MPPPALTTGTPQPKPSLTINDLARIIQSNSDTVMGKMNAMEGRLGGKMDAQEAKLTVTNENLRALTKRVADGKDGLDDRISRVLSRAVEDAVDKAVSARLPDLQAVPPSPSLGQSLVQYLSLIHI